jgi:hypothetical protein
MVDQRTDRDVGTRATSQRTQAWTPPQTLPTPKPQNGYVFRWIRTSLMGQMDPTNTSSKLREGWEPVRAADHVDLMLQADPNSRFKDNIEVGGLLLCKAPSELMEQRNAYYAKQANSQMEAVDNNFMRQRDDRTNMELFSERKSEVTFGRGTKTADSGS